MKTTVFLLLTIFCCSLKAQQVVATAGEQFSNINGSISYTVGEGVANTFTGGDQTLTQGFHQTTISIAVFKDSNVDEFSMTAFPNPAIQTVTLKTDQDKISGMRYLMTDQGGKIIVQKKIESEETVIPVEQLPDGVYIIKILDNQKELKSFKIIKQ